MRQNFPGLLAWILFLIGLAAGGVWLVMLGTSDDMSTIVPGVIALVCLVASGAMWLAIRYVLRNDPLEPEVTQAEEQVYLQRRRRKRRRVAKGVQGGEPV